MKRTKKGFIKTHTKRITQKNTTSPYSSEDYHSNDGMLTTVWGPPTWHMLHTISFNYPVNPTHEDKVNYRNFILSLRNVLPCGKCRKNLTKNFKKLPLTMDKMKSRDTFSKYVYDLHEVVNDMLHKKSGLSYENVRERYEHFRARCAIIKQIQDEKGCIVPLTGEKAKCVLKIVPQDTKCNTFQVDDKCIKKRIVLPEVEK